MGNLFSNSMNWGTVWREPDTTPYYLEPTTFDPHEGFEYKRKERGRIPLLIVNPSHLYSV